jgi:hypothetical protein
MTVIGNRHRAWRISLFEPVCSFVQTEATPGVLHSASLGALTMLTGCIGISRPSSTPKTYPITITATIGEV